jgi:hypothetical protein
MDILIYIVETASVKKDDEDTITDNIKFHDPDFVPLNLNTLTKKKLPYWYTNSLKEKREATEREIQEKQYKSLLHLLSKSKAFTSFMTLRCNEGLKSKTKKGSTKRKLTSIADDLSTQNENLNSNIVINNSVSYNSLNKDL